MENLEFQLGRSSISLKILSTLTTIDSQRFHADQCLLDYIIVIKFCKNNQSIVHY